MFPDLSARSNPLKEALLWDRASMDPNARNAKRATRVKPTRTRRLRLNLRIDCDVALAIVSACRTLRLPLFFSAMQYRKSCTSCDFFLDELVPQFGNLPVRQSVFNGDGYLPSGPAELYCSEIQEACLAIKKSLRSASCVAALSVQRMSREQPFLVLCGPCCLSALT